MPNTITDSRLKPVSDAINAGRVKVLSLDVFDTLLWRKVPEPHDVFLMLARRLADAGRLAANVTPVQFAELRRLAETRAREKVQRITGYREITLQKIYAEIPGFLFAGGFDAAQALRAELELETSLMVLDADLVALITKAHAAGVRVVLISDTYFSSAEIAVFLARAGMSDQKQLEQIVVSCEAGKPKWRDLFDVLVPKLGVKPSEMFHVGDNPDADITPCRRLGIPCIDYGKWAFSPRTKQNEFPTAIHERSAALSERGDFGLTGLRSRFHHRAPAALSPQLQFFWSYGAAVMAPIFAGFGRWVVQSAHQSKADAVYGLMREGRFLKRVVDQTSQHLGIKTNFQELWLSRRAVIRSALYPGEHDLIGEFVLATPGRTTDEILSHLGLTRADLAQADPQLAGFDTAQPDAFVTLIRAVGMNPTLRAKLIAQSQHHRPGLLKALAQSILFDKNARVMLVDLGYSATIQAVLQRILKHEGMNVDMSGLYFALGDKAAANILSGIDLQAYLSADGFGAEAVQVLMRTPDVLEHACMCDEGSLAGFDDAGNVQLLPNRRSEKQLSEMHAMQDGIMEGVRQINILFGSLDQTPAHENPALARQIAAISVSAMLHPTLDEAKRIGAWRHEAKVDAMPALSLASATFDFANLEYGGWNALQSATRDQVYWPAATFHIADPSLGEAYANGIQKSYTAEQLTSNPLLGAIEIYPNLGGGFDRQRAGKVAMNVNSFGRGFLAATIKAMGAEVYTQVRLSWPMARAVIQVDQAAVIYTTDDGPRRIDLLTSAVWTEVTPLEGGAVMGAQQAILTFDLAGFAPSTHHGLDLELRFKYLQLDSILGAG